ncbi:MAG: hypothetical protein BGO67_11360 [Alphaproteobacteria bacterium 41-28]|nr:MAG: hypothetical protein BGO67_11360 [Alphaproteobacteria bacterium 41-28]
MDKKEKFIKKTESTLEKYKDKISKIDVLLANYKSADKAQLVSESKKIKENLKKADVAFKKLQSSSQDTFEEIKEYSLEIFDKLNDSFDEFSTHLTIDQLHHYKDEIANYSCDKMNQAQDYIKKNPLTCAAYALGIGFIIGKLLSRSK